MRIMFFLMVSSLDNTSAFGAQKIHEKAIHLKRVTVRCAFRSGRIIRWFFFTYATGNAVAVNDECYCGNSVWLYLS